MKSALYFFVVLGLLLGSSVWVGAQPSGHMSGSGGMMGQGMMGGGMMRGKGMMGKESSPPQTAGKAESVYRSVCASCHGVTGKGDGPAVAALNPKPHDFTNCKMAETHSDDFLFKIIKGGGSSVGRSPVMPPWGGSFTDEQIRDLVGYVRGLCGR